MSEPTPIRKPRRRRKPPRGGFWATLGERPTADLVILALTVTVAASIFALVVLLIWVKVFQPHIDTDGLARQVGQFISSAIAVIVGYVAGRGASNTPPDPPK